MGAEYSDSNSLIEKSMSEIKEQAFPKVDGDGWPKLSTEEEYLSTCGKRIVNLYYYRDPKTGHIDIDRTLHTMFWLFNGCKVHPTETLSAYLSIINIFTYPEFQNIAPKLPSLAGIKFQPTPFTDITWPKESIPEFDIPLSSDDQLAALAMYILMFEFQNVASIVASASEVITDVGAFASKLLDVRKLVEEPWKQTAAYMMSPFNIPFSKHIYECLLFKAVARGNKKVEQLLRFCGEKLPTIMTCETMLFKSE